MLDPKAPKARKLWPNAVPPVGSVEKTQIAAMGMGQDPVPLVNIPKMIIIVFSGMFTYPILMVIGIDPWPYVNMLFLRWAFFYRRNLPTVLVDDFG